MLRFKYLFPYIGLCDRNETQDVAISDPRGITFDKAYSVMFHVKTKALVITVSEINYHKDFIYMTIVALMFLYIIMHHT
jgi:hypothetical protein